MDSRRRWSLLSLAMAGTLAAIFYPDESANELSDAVIAPVFPARSAAVSTNVKATLDPNIPSAWLAPVSDPFASKGWQTAPVAAPQTVAAQAPVAAIDLSPPPPPTLPFKFVGQMTDGSDRVVYLSNGDQVVLARQGDVLDGGYKVLLIGPALIEFELVSSGLKQSLAIPAKDS